MADVPSPPPEGLSESRFGLRFYVHEMRVLIDIIDLRRKSGELWGEMTVRCNLEGVRAQLDGNRLRQGNFNFSSVATRKLWANALGDMTGDQVPKSFSWASLLERVCQSVLDHERLGNVRGGPIVGGRIDKGGRPWAAYPILPAGEMATLFARGGAGKTSLVALAAFGMAYGRSFIPGVRVDRPYRVAILDWETNAETANDLWGLIAETHGVAVPDGVWYEPMETPLERALPKVATVLEKARADVVIIDSVMMSMVSSADGQGDPAEAITRVYQSLRRLGAWGLLIDHVTGGDMTGRRVAMKAYGSIFKLNLARHALALHIGTRTGDSSQAYLVCPKSNVGRDRWAMPGTIVRSDEELRWSFGDMDYELYDRLMATGTDEEGTETPEEPFATPRQAEQILAALLSAYPTGRTVAGVAAAIGSRSIQYIRRSLHALERDGLALALDQPRGREKIWTLTQQGIDTAGGTAASGASN